MCRWLCYFGSPIPLEALITKPENSLVVQALHSQLGAETTNGDGFGMGWYGDSELPGLYHSIHPAWNDKNVADLAEHISSRLFFAHIRAATHGTVQETNCHPFRYGRWLFMHNGSIKEFTRLRRDLMLAVDAEYFPLIEGTTDTETMFYLALTFGLQEDPPGAVERMVGFVEATAEKHGVEAPMQMTIATTDGQSIWVFRYASAGTPRSLFYSSSRREVLELYPDDPRFANLSNETRIVVSEPLGELPGVWNEVPPSSYGIVQLGQDEIHPFAPQRP